MRGNLERQVGQLHEAVLGERVEPRVRRVERDLARPVVGVRPERGRHAVRSLRTATRSVIRGADRGPLVPVSRTRPASSANSHSSGRVSRGSMISSTRNASAVLNGDWRAVSRCSISARSASGSSAASSCALYAASMPPSSGRLPQFPDGHANRYESRDASWCAAPATPYTLRTITEHHGVVAW